MLTIDELRFVGRHRSRRWDLRAKLLSRPLLALVGIFTVVHEAVYCDPSFAEQWFERAIGAPYRVKRDEEKKVNIEGGPLTGFSTRETRQVFLRLLTSWAIMITVKIR